eukprot:6205095-Pleurochrysis_carterae.AAC.5
MLGTHATRIPDRDGMRFDADAVRARPALPVPLKYLKYYTAPGALGVCGARQSIRYLCAILRYVS